MLTPGSMFIDGTATRQYSSLMVSRVATLGMVLALVPSADGAVAAGASKVARDAVRQRGAIMELLNRAVLDVYQADGGCRPPSVLRRHPSVTDKRPSDRLLATLGVLRRSQTEEEARVGPDGFDYLPAAGIYGRYVRLVHAAGGRSYLIVPARDTDLYKPRPKRCVRALRERFTELVVDRPASFRRAARRMLDQVIRTQWTAPDRGPREGVFLFDYAVTDGRRSGGGGVGATFIRRYGMFGSLQRGRASRSIVSGLVPDGVATVTALFGRKASRGRHRSPKLYPRAVKRTGALQDNVVSFTVPRPARDALPDRQVWRAPDGTIKRTVGRPR